MSHAKQLITAIDIGSTEGWYSKSQAAAKLQTSEKTIDRMAARNEIERRVQSIPGQGKNARPVFNPEQIDSIAREKGLDSTALAIAPANHASGLTADPQQLVVALANILQRQQPQPSATAPDALLPSELRHKRWLTLDEAVAYSGLPKSIIVAKAQRLDGIRRVRFLREDLERL